MADEIPLTLQTAYAELLDRSVSAAFSEAFPEEGAFTPKTVRGRRYWYFQSQTPDGRRQRYVGPETPELLQRIAEHKRGRDDERERRALVSTLLRSAHLPRPLPQTGEVVAVMAKAGVFRLRGVLVGTVAYQTYAAMLAVRLSAAAIQTGDVDIAQFGDVSIAVEDHTPAMLDILRQVDASFRPVPSLRSRQRIASYATTTGLRVDFLTPNVGPDTDKLKPLPALGTDAQPLRFLDFLIRDPEPAVLLHGTGVHVMVPAPERYAVHKLIVARRRRDTRVKSDKDILQAAALLKVLAAKRSDELRIAFAEAWDRGDSWRKSLVEGIGLLETSVRDEFLRVIGIPRSLVPNLKLEFAAPAARYDFDRDIIAFSGNAGGSVVRCAISRAALEDHFGGDGLDKNGLLRKFRENRDEIEALASVKYLRWPIESFNILLITTQDVLGLRKSLLKSGPPKKSHRSNRP